MRVAIIVLAIFQEHFEVVRCEDKIKLIQLQ